jgi:ABC-2 type transport system ATP-binding protein
MNAIEIDGMTKVYKGKKWSSVEALKNLSLSVPQGEIFGFLGPNGAGKSTTIKTLMGLVRPTSGSARIMGVDIGSRDARRHVGYLPENPAFYDYLSAEEYLGFVGKTFSLAGPVLRKRREDALQLLDLWGVRKRPMRGYSKGMVQRVGLAQVLIHDPDVYILDEPMSGLDPVGRALVKSILLDLKARGKCVFFSTHIISDVETVCDRIGIIMKGELQSVKCVGSIMTEGVEEYSVTVIDDAGTIKEYGVDCDQLPTFLAQMSKQGLHVKLVEPNRKHLEDFFLSIIQTKGGEVL